MATEQNKTQAEIDQFNTMAGEWWDPDGPCAPLHALNPIRHKYIQKTLTLENASILDIGCGGGLLTEAMAKNKAHVIGIDAAEKCIAIAKAHAKESNLDIHYQITTAETFAQTHAAHFDAITCMELLEHVPDPLSLIQACATMLKPGGQLYLSTLNRTLKAYLFAIIGAEFVLKLLPKRTHHYDQFIRPSELALWLQQSQLQLVDLQGISYQPFCKQAQFSKDVAINYLAHAVK